MTEDLPVGLLGIHSLSVFSMVPNQVIGEMVLNGGGRFSPARYSWCTHIIFIIIVPGST